MSSHGNLALPHWHTESVGAELYKTNGALNSNLFPDLQAGFGPKVGISIDHASTLPVALRGYDLYFSHQT